MNYSLTSPGKLLGVFFCLLVISGCATTPEMYNWGDYESQVYARFSTNANPEQQIEAMEKTLQTNKNNKPAPPGFHAHLGLLYGEAGRINDMREQFAIEKKLFPESTAFMDFLLTKSAQNQNKTQGKTQ